jgi:hypothetical protein
MRLFFSLIFISALHDLFWSIKDMGLQTRCIQVQTDLDLLRQTVKHRVPVLHKSCTSVTMYSINDGLWRDNSQLIL